MTTLWDTTGTEVVKALAADPQVLLLDEPTSSLDISGVEKLTEIVRRIVAAGVAVVYVSHRLPEILALANRVTILRDGVGQGTYEVNERLSENDLIALMVGRPIEAEYPVRPAVAWPEISSVSSICRSATGRWAKVNSTVKRIVRSTRKFRGRCRREDA